MEWEGERERKRGRGREKERVREFYPGLSCGCPSSTAFLVGLEMGQLECESALR